jgi:Flp pilus assembly protein TadD
MFTFCKQLPRYWISLLIGAFTFVIFSPVLWFEFCLFDDPSYVFDNPHVNSGLSWSNLRWALTSLHGEISYWHPVTWISHQIDCQLFALSSGAHHLSSVVLHIVAGLLLFRFLAVATRNLGASAFVAGLFCIHPLHVESVAWISERKDVLSAVFWMAALNAYLFYAERSNLGRYALVMLFTVLGLASKPSVVTLPFTLLLLDYWPLNRIRWPRPSDAGLSRDEAESQNTCADKTRHEVGSGLTRGSLVPDSCRCYPERNLFGIILEKSPLFIVALAAAIAAYIAQVQLGAVASTSKFGLSDRLDNVLVTYFLYLKKAFWPTDLSVIYARTKAWPFYQVILCGILLFGISAVAFRHRRKYPYVLVGWLWFIGTLVPMIGVVQVGSQFMADRYSYISLIGIFIVAAWGMRDLVRALGIRRDYAFALASATLVISSILTHFQLLNWKDSLALFGHAARVTDGNGLAHENFSFALGNAGRYEEADIQLAQAEALLPASPGPKRSRGNLCLVRGKPAEAIPYFIQAIRCDPRDVEAHEALSLIYGAAENPDLRSAELALAHALLAHKYGRPDDWKESNALAIAYAEAGQFDRAVFNVERARTLCKGNDTILKELEMELSLFKSHQPFRKKFEDKQRNRLDFNKQISGQNSVIPKTLAGRPNSE